MDSITHLNDAGLYDCTVGILLTEQEWSMVRDLTRDINQRMAAVRCSALSELEMMTDLLRGAIWDRHKAMKEARDA